jgi:toxin ParE1/3/4
MRIDWTARALRNLAEIREDIEIASPKGADTVGSRIAEAVETLEHSPHIGRLGRLLGTRELVVVGTPYIIPYRMRRERIELLAVLHGARKWPKRL